MSQHVAVKTNFFTLIIGLAAASVSSSPARADVVYETQPPGGFFGYWGSDVYDGQSVAVRFTPSADYTLDRANVWFMNNDSEGGHPPVTLTLQSDNAKAAIPGEVVLETWQFNVSTVGWDPVLEHLDSVVHPTLHAGENYWLVARSNAPGGYSGVWVFAAEGTGFMAICNGIPCDWFSGESAIAGTVVEGTPILPACEGDVSPAPNGDQTVNIDDLVVIITHWGTTGAPGTVVGDVNSNGVVNIDDLVALITNWGACP